MKSRRMHKLFKTYNIIRLGEAKGSTTPLKFNSENFLLTAGSLF